MFFLIGQKDLQIAFYHYKMIDQGAKINLAFHGFF